MFEREQAIATWREAQAALPADVRDELEEHLRSSTDALAAGELSEAEAFLIAQHRIGTPTELDAEFAKVPGSHAERRLRWMIVGVLAALAVPALMRIVSKAGAIGAAALGVPETLLAWVAGTCTVLFCIWAWRHVFRVANGHRSELLGLLEGEPVRRRTRVLMSTVIITGALAMFPLDYLLVVGLLNTTSSFGTSAVFTGTAIATGLVSMALVLYGVVILARRRTTPSPL